MKISYIPQVVSNVKELPGTEAAKGFLQNAIEDAISNSIVIPFKNWCYEVTTKSLMLAEWGLIFGCAFGIIFWICGIEKGKKTAKVCTIIFLGVQIFKVVFL